MAIAPLHAIVLDGKGGCRDATASEIQTGRSEDGVTWLHVDYSSDATPEWLQVGIGLDELTVEALSTEDPRPRSLVVGEGLLVFLRGINVNEGSEPEDMVSLRMWADKDRVITLRHRRVAAVRDVVDQLRRGNGPVSAGDIVQEVTDRLLDRIGLIAQDIEDSVDAIEEQLLTAESREIRIRLSELRRRAIALRRYVAPQRDMLARLHTERVGWLDDRSRAHLRECADRITRYMESMDSARERAAVTSEELSSRLAEQMNQTMYMLSIVAAIFLPLGLLTGLLGINVGGVPGTESPWAFALVTFLLVVMGIGEFMWFKRRSMF